MVKPENNVVIIVEVRAGHRDWLVCVMGEDGKRTSRIEADPADGGGIYAVLVRSSFDSCTYT